jgi:hypothetical protein
MAEIEVRPLGGDRFDVVLDGRWSFSVAVPTALADELGMAVISDYFPEFRAEMKGRAASLSRAADPSTSSAMASADVDECGA